MSAAAVRETRTAPPGSGRDCNLLTATFPRVGAWEAGWREGGPRRRPPPNPRSDDLDDRVAVALQVGRRQADDGDLVAAAAVEHGVAAAEIGRASCRVRVSQYG